MGLTEWIETRLKPAYVDVDSPDDIVEAVMLSGAGSRACVGIGDKLSDFHTAFVTGAEKYRGKIIFAWVQGPESSAQFLAGGKEAVICGAGACDKKEDFAKWLDEQVDPLTTTSTTTTAAPVAEELD